MGCVVVDLVDLEVIFYDGVVVFIGGILLAGDGTKLRAQNSKKNNFNEKKIERHIAYIDDKLHEYSAILASEDKDLTEEQKQEINDKIDKHQQHKAKYEGYKKQLDETGTVQISTSDPDSRQMIVRNNITEVAYNVQSTVDAKHKIPIDFKVTNKNDSKAMGAMVRRAKTILGHTDFTAIFDKGYHTGTEFDYAHKHGIMIKLPKFRKSLSDYMCDPNSNAIYKGIGSLKNIGKDVGESLYTLKDNHYDTFFDLLNDMNIKKDNMIKPLTLI
jgi:hypothetical protein